MVQKRGGEVTLAASATTDRGRMLLERMRTLPAVKAVMDRAATTQDTFRVYAGLWKAMTPDGTVSLHDPHELAERALRVADGVQTWAAQIRWLEERGFIQKLDVPSGGAPRVAMNDPVEVLRVNWFLYAATVEELISVIDEVRELRPIAEETRRERRRSRWINPAALPRRWRR